MSTLIPFSANTIRVRWLKQQEGEENNIIADLRLAIIVIKDSTA
jgi:hypothetical protein